MMTAESRRAAMPRPRKIDHGLAAEAEARVAPELWPASVWEVAGMTVERVRTMPPLDGAVWHALKVTPGQEAIAMAHLVGRGYGCYLPMQRARKGHQGTEACFPVPQMAGYVLARLWPRDWPRVRHIPGVTGLLMADAGTPAVIPDEEVARCKRIEVETDMALATRIEQIEAAMRATPRAPRRRRRRSRRARPSK